MSYESTSSTLPVKSGRKESDALLVRISLTEAKDSSARLGDWEFPGWGKHDHMNVSMDELTKIEANLSVEHAKLGEWPATAICGNDILSSCLYVSGLVTAKSGKLAPLVLALVAGVLYLYRFIYGEVVSAIPLNGGSYSVLLNTTTKRVASFAASLAILAYIATGVVSGTSACIYLETQFPGMSVVNGAICLLFCFAVLCFIGISESSMVALLMFVGHTLTLGALCVCSVVYVFHNPLVFYDNLKTDFPEINMAGHSIAGSAFTALFFGFATAMLGISGFETSSQYVEEQLPGVFPKTLRNMWWGVAIFNPLISLLSIGVLPMSDIISHQNTLLSAMGRVVGGSKLEAWISYDAFIVLSGAVLTSYVGITGLVRRLASDRVLPDFLLDTNRWRGTNHYIIFGYFLTSSSLVFILDGDVETLSGVYTYSFLGLMMLFACGCMLLKYKRAELPRKIVAPWWMCSSALIMVFLGFLGNLLGDPTVLTYFAIYFLAVFSIVMIMLERTFMLRIILYFMRKMCPSRHTKMTYSGTGARGGRTIARTIQEINEGKILFFCKKPDLSTINKAILYVRTNEQTSNLVIVHVCDVGEGVAPNFSDTVAMFDRIYPKIKIDFLTVDGQFGPAMIEYLAKTLNIPKNMMFIKQTDSLFAHEIASLGGVRVITS